MHGQTLIFSKMIMSNISKNKRIVKKTGKYINREEAWLEFNARVLEEGTNPKNPLIERLRFLGIFTTNLDEFFMVRVAGLKKMQQEGFVEYDSPDDTETPEILERLEHRTKYLVEEQYRCFHEDIIPALRERKIKIINVDKVSSVQKDYLDDYFQKKVFPILTPLSYDAAHPFPFLSNLSMYLLLVPEVENSQGPRICFVEMPSVLPRLIAIPSKEGQHQFVMLGDLIFQNFEKLFLGVKFSDKAVLRVTRNLDYDLLENEVVDLLKSMQKEVIVREHQEVVRLEVDSSLPDGILNILLRELGISKNDIYQNPGPLYLGSFSELGRLPMSDLKYRPFNPRLPMKLASKENIFSLIAEEDILVHHPFESFYTVTEFLASAAMDPDVLAIKLTLYRTGGGGALVESLIEAANQGKQVTAVLELKARFDEKNNIAMARRLEKAGVNVVFGFVGLKTHCKAALVVRKEGDDLARYVHLSTGNYNPQTAKFYTDIGYFTDDEDLAGDITNLFNMVTAFNMLNLSSKSKTGKELPRIKKIAVAPLNLRDRWIELIENETVNASHNKEAYICAKMNSLVDRKIIDKLYEASQAGVNIRLIVRGICCLRPGVQGLSDNIQVISIVDRFLEHSRIFHFCAGGKDKVYLSSADWMPRNMDRRVEIMFPILGKSHRGRVINEILRTYWNDNERARRMNADGTYSLRTPKVGEELIRSQFRFIDLAREAGIKSLPYDKALKYRSYDKGKRPVQTTKKRKRD